MLSKKFSNTINENEVTELLNAPDSTQNIWIRDKAMLELLAIVLPTWAPLDMSH